MLIVAVNVVTTGL